MTDEAISKLSPGPTSNLSSPGGGHEFDDVDEIMAYRFTRQAKVLRIEARQSSSPSQTPSSMSPITRTSDASTRLTGSASPPVQRTQSADRAATDRLDRDGTYSRPLSASNSRQESPSAFYQPAFANAMLGGGMGQSSGGAGGDGQLFPQYSRDFYQPQQQQPQTQTQPQSQSQTQSQPQTHPRATPDLFATQQQVDSKNGILDSAFTIPHDIQNTFSYYFPSDPNQTPNQASNSNPAMQNSQNPTDANGFPLFPQFTQQLFLPPTTGTTSSSAPSTSTNPPNTSGPESYAHPVNPLAWLDDLGLGSSNIDIGPLGGGNGGLGGGTAGELAMGMNLNLGAMDMSMDGIESMDLGLGELPLAAQNFGAEPYLPITAQMMWPADGAFGAPSGGMYGIGEVKQQAKNGSSNTENVDASGGSSGYGS